MTNDIMNPAFNINGEHPAERLYSAQATSSDVNLRGDLPPTRNQVSAVLRGLADFTHNQHMLSQDVAELGADRKNFGNDWAQASGLGRYFHGLAEQLQTFNEPGSDEEALADRHGLVPIYTEDKVDGSDVVTVDWKTVQRALIALEAENAALRTVQR